MAAIYRRGPTAICTIANRVGPTRHRQDGGMGCGLRLVAALAGAHAYLGFRTRTMCRIFAARLTSPLDSAPPDDDGATNPTRELTAWTG